MVGMGRELPRRGALDEEPGRLRLGLNVVVVCLRVDPPWGGTPIALPLNLRIRAKKNGKKTTELAAEMVAEIAGRPPELAAAAAANDWQQVTADMRGREAARLVAVFGRALVPGPQGRPGPPGHRPRPFRHRARRLLRHHRPVRHRSPDRHPLRRPLAHRVLLQRGQAARRGRAPPDLEAQRSGPCGDARLLASHRCLVLLPRQLGRQAHLARPALVHPQGHPELPGRPRRAAPRPVAPANYRHVVQRAAPRQNTRPAARHARRGCIGQLQECETSLLWAPLNFATECLHFMTFEDAAGKPWAKTAAVLPVIPKDAPLFGPGTEAEPIEEARHQVRWAAGLRRSQDATLTFSRAGEPQRVQLKPLLTFRMRGAGYMHPTWGTAAGMMRWRCRASSTGSKNSTPSIRRASTFSRWCAPPGQSGRARRTREAGHRPAWAQRFPRAVRRCRILTAAGWKEQ